MRSKQMEAERPPTTPTIIVVEDSRTQAEALAYLLESAGYRPLIARNGQEGLELLAAHEPALIISDVVMPQMNGFEFCRRVKADPRWKSIPVILLTALSETLDIIHGLECGADNFVTKPYDNQYLLSRVEQLLGSRRLRQAQQSQQSQQGQQAQQAQQSQQAQQESRHAVTVEFGGRLHQITSERQQILDLLLSTYEQAVQINRRLRQREEQLEATNAQLAALHAIGNAVSRSLDLSQILGDALDQLTATAGIDTALLFLLEGGELMLKAHRNLPARAAAAIERLPLDERERAELEALDEPLVGRPERLPSSLAETARRIDCQSVMCVSLRSKGVVHGLMLVGTAFREAFTRGDMELLRGASQQLAVAIENARLYEAERAARAQAEEANRAKDEFLAMVSHELRTPLNAILGWVTLLHEGRVGEEHFAHALESVRRATLAQNQLVNDLLDVSRITSGKLALNPCQMSLPEVIDQALETVQHSAAAKGVEIESRIERDIPFVYGDPGRLRQVVTNLLTNAIKFTPRGGRVEVSLGAKDGQAEIRVSDTGQGIEPEFLGRVFERFHQADNTITRKHGGLGLGLSIVRHLVDQHGGTVRAESAGHNQGATFIVTLPFAAASILSAPTRRKTRTEAPETPRLALEHVRVLVVDDQPDARELLGALLAQHGAEVRSVASAAEALAALPALRPHVIVSDIAMPGKDGYQFIREVRSLAPEQGGEIPAVAVSALGPEDQRRALASGYQSFLVKPVEPAEVVSTITSLLHDSH